MSNVPIPAGNLREWFISGGGIDRQEARDLVAAAGAAPGANDTERLAHLLTTQGTMTAEVAQEAARRIVDELVHHPSDFRIVTFEPGSLALPDPASRRAATRDAARPAAQSGLSTPPPGGFVSTPHGLHPGSDHAEEHEYTLSADLPGTFGLGFERETLGTRETHSLQFTPGGNGFDLRASMGRDYRSWISDHAYIGWGTGAQLSYGQRGDVSVIGAGANVAALLGFRGDTYAVDMRLGGRGNGSFNANFPAMSHDAQEAQTIAASAETEMRNIQTAAATFQTNLGQISREFPDVASAVDQAVAALNAVSAARTPMATMAALGALGPALSSLGTALEAAGVSYAAAKVEVDRFAAQVQTSMTALQAAVDNADFRNPQVGGGGGFAGGLTVDYTQTLARSARTRFYSTTGLTGEVRGQYVSAESVVPGQPLSLHLGARAGLGVETRLGNRATVGLLGTGTFGATAPIEGLAADQFTTAWGGGLNLYFRTAQ